MRIAQRLLVVAIFVAALAAGWRFAGQNASPVTVDYLLGQVGEVALWVALLGAFALGSLLATGAWLFQIAKLRLVVRRYRKSVQRLEAEVHQLRNLPLAAEEPAPPPLTDPAGGAVLERGT